MSVTLSFIQLSRAWYAEANLKDADFLDELHIQAEKSGVLVCEFAMRWYQLEKGKPAAPRLEVFDDARGGFVEYFGDFLRMLGGYDSGNWSPEKIAGKLVKLGVEDVTQIKKAKSGLTDTRIDQPLLYCSRMTAKPRDNAKIYLMTATNCCIMQQQTPYFRQSGYPEVDGSPSGALRALFYCIFFP